MALWGKTDIEGSKPKWVNLATQPAGTQLVFVDRTEATTPSNRSKGLVNGGWWLYREAVDQDGNKRYFAECLVAMDVTAAIAGDAADDLTVPDVNTVITISVHPADQTTVAGSATFSVTAAFSAGTGTLLYQWQRKTATGKWTNVAGATSASLVRSGQTSTNTGDQYRVMVSGGGAKTVTSNVATLTFGS